MNQLNQLNRMNRMGVEMSIKISQSMADSIVREIGREIELNINFMDHTGRIIAAKDPTRIGMLHHGAQRIIAEELDELTITAEMATLTTREGINLPILVYDEVVGVIGITGPVGTVKGYGNIVKRMTQILLEDRIKEVDLRLERHIRYRYVEQWLRPGHAVTPEFTERGRQLGIDITIPRRALAIRIVRLGHLNETLDGQRKIDQIDDEIRGFIEREPGAVYLYMPSHYLCLVRAQSDEELERICQKIGQLVEGKLGEPLLIGLDGIPEGSTSGAILNDQAMRALKAAEETGQSMMFYHQLSLETILYDIPLQSIQHFLDTMFGTMPQVERRQILELAECFFRQEGSIAAMAEALYLHGNTVQYRLKKVVADIGLDLRRPSQAVYFNLALNFEKVLAQRSQHISKRLTGQPLENWFLK